MAYYNKIGFLLLNEDRTHFLVCEKSIEYDTTEYIMPGGVLLEESDEECLMNELDEELSCKLIPESLQFVGEYEGRAAGWEDRDVHIKLYTGKLIGIPTPSSEIEQIHWIGKEDVANERVSAIIREQIIPDLVAKKLLR